MKYAILKCINGNYFVHAEGFTAIESAIAQFHELCKILWGAPDVITGYVMIVDEQFNCVEWYREAIHHEPQE